MTRRARLHGHSYFHGSDTSIPIHEITGTECVTPGTVEVVVKRRSLDAADRQMCGMSDCCCGASMPYELYRGDIGNGLVSIWVSENSIR